MSKRSKVDRTQHKLNVANATLHVEQFGKSNDIAALLVHGAIENGRIFYPGRGFGLAGYLASNGIEVYVPDLRGKGKSVPKTRELLDYGQFEAIHEDLDAIVNWIGERRGNRRLHIISHSWGGVLLLSCLAAMERLPSIDSLIFCGTRRSIRMNSVSKILKMQLLWIWVGGFLASCLGHVPTKWFMRGEEETLKMHRESVAWIKSGSEWVNPANGLDYGSLSAERVRAIPKLWLVGAGDHALAASDDAHEFAKNFESSTFQILGKAGGQCRDYGHIDMLISQEAIDDVFPLILDWINNASDCKDS